MEKTYWNRQGKHQEWVDEVSATMPDMYYTDNKYMNVFIAMSNIYYDIYNNGGGNIQDCYKDALKYIHGFIGKFNSRTAMKDYDYLENKANEVFEKLMEKDLAFENHGFWNNWRDRKVSMNEQSGECWIYITCGTEYNTEKEFKRRKTDGFEEV